MADGKVAREYAAKSGAAMENMDEKRMVDSRARLNECRGGVAAGVGKKLWLVAVGE